MTKRVLITGITGMAGSHLADYLLDHHEDVAVFGTYRWRSSKANIEGRLDKLHLYECDLTDYINVLHLVRDVRPDYVFHLAAQSFVPTSWAAPAATVSDNASMQIHLFEALREAGLNPPTQIALSSEEYGMVLPEEAPINEDNPIRPLSPYAVSKITQDMLGYQYHHSYGMHIIRTRTFNHTGPRRGEVFATSNFAKQIAEIEAGLKPPVVYVGNLEAKRDWCDVRDVVRAYWLGAQRCKPGELYVIASGKAFSVGEMLDLLLKQSPVEIEVRPDPARMRPSDVPLLLGDYTKMNRDTGWKPEIPFEQTLKDLLDWWRGRVAKA